LSKNYKILDCSGSVFKCFFGKKWNYRNSHTFFFVYTIFCLNFACILKILLPNQVCIKKEPNEKPNVLKNLNQIFVKDRKKTNQEKNHDKRFNFA